MTENKIIWEVWFNRMNCDNVYLSTGQVNVVAHTIEEAITKVRCHTPYENRMVYKVEDKGSIIE
jgi:hypothetical protein